MRAGAAQTLSKHGTAAACMHVGPVPCLLSVSAVISDNLGVQLLLNCAPVTLSLAV